jgi:GNAT superfamily N-acetyltransferase
MAPHCDLPSGIRAATRRDATAIARLATQLGYPTGPEACAERLVEIRRRADDAVLVAEVGGRVVGWVHVFGARRVESEPFAELGGLVVDEAERGRGIGGWLVEAAEGWAREHGFATIRVRSNVVREDALRFYDRRRYVRSKTQAVFTKRLGEA